MKQVPVITAAAAAALIRPGQTVLVGGFGMTGYPVRTIDALADAGTGGLTYVGNNVGEPGIGGGRLVRNGQISKVIGSYFTSNREVVEAAQAGELEVELLPQGSLAEAMRAAGAGIGGFFTPTGANTTLSSTLETRRIDGQDMVLVKPLRGDVALIRGFRADTLGNLQYRMTENNFNHAAATAATTVIAEVTEIVAAGDIAPEQVHTPGCFVDYLVIAPLTEADLGSSAAVGTSRKKSDQQRLQIARSALAELAPGDIVNIGVGMPTLVADLLNPEHQVTLHTENGLLGVGPEPPEGGAMNHPVNASKVPVTALPGASYFDSTTSFAMIRGGHIDVAIMGGLQVDAYGNLANWAVPGKPLLGVGGAMDLASGARRVIIMMTHQDRQGQSKLVSECTLPLTAPAVVDTLITDLGKFRFAYNNGQSRAPRVTLVEMMPGVSRQQIEQATEFQFAVDLEPPTGRP